MHRDPFGDREVWEDYFWIWREQGRRVVGYGASAKATVFLNYCGVTPDLMEYVVDSTPEKQGKYIPGCGIPILPVRDEELTFADIVVILAHNYRAEILSKIPEGPEVWCQLRRLR